MIGLLDAFNVALPAAACLRARESLPSPSIMLRPSINLVLPFVAAWLATGAQTSPVVEGHSIAARSTWEPNEVSATECSWEAPRGMNDLI